uniref:Domain of unknown function with conserved HDNR motif domain-containing protein n=1 Tax=Sus scrofa TaxID=9823 RepID=A0A8D1KS28_PIG
MAKGRCFNPPSDKEGLWFPHIGLMQKTPESITSTMLKEPHSPRLQRRVEEKLPPIYKLREKQAVNNNFPFSVHDNRYSFQDSGFYLDSVSISMFFFFPPLYSMGTKLHLSTFFFPHCTAWGPSYISPCSNQTRSNIRAHDFLRRVEDKGLTSELQQGQNSSLVTNYQEKTKTHEVLEVPGSFLFLSFFLFFFFCFLAPHPWHLEVPGLGV